MNASLNPCLSLPTLRERIQYLVEHRCQDSSQKIQKISQYAGLHPSNISRYLRGEQEMRLYNIGRLIAAIQRYLEKDLNESGFAQEASIANLSKGLPPDEYHLRLKVTGARQLEQILSSRLPEDLCAPVLPEAQARAYADHLIDTWENLDAGERVLHEVYIPQCFVDDQKKAEDVLFNWATSPDGVSFFLMLGDIGMGKTTALQAVAARLAAHYQENPDTAPLPIYCDLSEVRHIGKIELVFGDFFNRHFSGKIPNLDYLLALSKIGKIVLLLDGFDEMARRLSTDVLYENISQLDRLYHEKGKLLLSSRNQLFSTTRQMNELLVFTEMGSSLTKNQGQIRELAPFTEPDVARYIENYYPENHGEMSTKLRRLPGFEALSTHPMMLEIIVRVLPDLADQTTLTQTELFDLYYLRWYARKQDRRIIESDKLRGFCQELAAALWMQKQPEMAYDLLKSVIREYFDPQDPLAFEHLCNAVGNDSFLTRKGNEWSFLHELFLYYFLARAVVYSSTADRILEHGDLPEEVIAFLKDMPLKMVDLVQRVQTFNALPRPTQMQKTAHANILQILACKGQDPALLDALSPKLLSDLRQFGVLTLLPQINRVLPGLTQGDPEKLSDLALASLMDALANECTRGGPFVFYSGRGITVSELLADCLQTSSPGTMNTPCDVEAFCKQVGDPDSNLSATALRTFFAACPDIFRLTGNTLGFCHDFWFHYFLARSWIERIEADRPEGIGRVPAHLETVRWFLALVPETDLVRTPELKMTEGFYDAGADGGCVEPGAISAGLVNWLAAAHDGAWREKAGNYAASLCLMILTRTGLALNRLSLKNGSYPACDLTEVAALAGLDLSGSVLNDACFDKADLTGAKLCDCQLRSASFVGTTLTEADLRRSDLSQAIFRSAYMAEADLQGCNLTGADFTNLGNSDKLRLQGAVTIGSKGLENIRG
ncbi:pentapeptide repeat-containing protein [Desulfosarcina sp. OttesenSCG-928-A07]|nr:pentapeptide repeat-containing protein [Desulfosarcina sp. OttesenSCG-928-G17]MDL2328151.1 pentapeptide repeat-containing protein [Desulfosarcina sp. OttesenSCG-928-A07]